MHVLQTPDAMLKRGIKLPKIMVINPKEKNVPIGMPYIRAYDGETDTFLVYRIILPWLMKSYSQYNWENIYEEITGYKYHMHQIYFCAEPKPDDFTGHVYSQDIVQPETETMTIEEMMEDLSYVDLDIIMEMHLMPTFMSDISEAIRKNVTNSWMWCDGYNKKNGLCTGYLYQPPESKTLIIIDLSWSIPEGVSVGLIGLINTMVDITNADLILTGGRSKFFTNDEAMTLKPEWVRANIPRANESKEFVRILTSNDMNYETVISFGDSDTPTICEQELQEISTGSVKKLYDFFVGERDRYGCSCKHGTGYARWVNKLNPHCKIDRRTDWAKMFN